MSQKTVHLVIARLITDEGLRLQFLRDPRFTLAEIRDQGFEMTSDEMDALLETDRDLWTEAAARIHPRLQRCSVRGEWWPGCAPRSER
ncbi:MAG: Os1348 family NHLP clan protein [Bacteroidales bacterium]